MERLIKHLEARVTSLEDKNKSRESVDLDLRRDILNLQKENFNLQREVTALKDERSGVKRDMLCLQGETFNLQREVTALKDELSEVVSLKNKVKYLEGISKDLSDFKKLRSLFNHMVVKAHGLVDSGAQNDTGGFETYQQLKKRLQQLEEMVVDTKTRLDDVEMSQQYNDHQCVQSKRITELEKTTDGNKQEIDLIHKSLALTKPNLFGAQLRTSRDLVAHVSMKLDVCYQLGHNDGWFDARSCCLLPQRDCVMAMGWRVCQTEMGELNVYLKTEPSSGVNHLGKTSYYCDLCQGVQLWKLEKGYRYWLEVERTKGKANVSWCYFMAWSVGY